MGVQPAAGVLAAKFLLGLGCLIAGLALVLIGVYRDATTLVVAGVALAVVGLLLVALKIMARNRPPT